MQCCVVGVSITRALLESHDFFTQRKLALPGASRLSFPLSFPLEGFAKACGFAKTGIRPDVISLEL